MAEMKSLRKLLFGISPSETSASVRGFPEETSPVRSRLEEIGKTFVLGYNAALDSSEPDTLGLVLNGVDNELRGFAYEGAAMSLALLDSLTPWNRGRFDAVLAGPGDAHAYMLHVGAGWAAARLKSRRSSVPAKTDQLLGWLAFDGFGFHQGFVGWENCFVKQLRGGRLVGPATKVFDQGLGRCAWFVYGARVERVAEVVASFAPDRHEDLWGGIGLAAAYAGGVSRRELADLATLSGVHRAALGQGAAFAAKARVRAGNETEHMDVACEEFFGGSGREAARLTEVAEEGLPLGGPEPAYLVWRRRIRKLLQ